MPNEPVWITADEVVRINQLQTAATGEPHGILRREGLEGAVARPRQVFSYGESPDVLDFAIALLVGIAKSHAFVQGNKRTAFVAAELFLGRNGYRLDLPDTSEVADRIVHAITGDEAERMLRDELVVFLKQI